MEEQERQLAGRIGSAVRHHRQLRGLSQEALAERIGLSTHFVGLVERGQQLPSLTTLLGLCRTLGVDLDELLGLRGPTAPVPWEREALAVFGTVPVRFRPAVVAMLRTLARTAHSRSNRAAAERRKKKQSSKRR